MVTSNKPTNNLSLARRLMGGLIASPFGSCDQRDDLGPLDQKILQAIVDFVETPAQAFKI
jgi:hypothetical protein